MIDTRSTQWEDPRIIKQQQQKQAVSSPPTQIINLYMSFRLCQHMIEIIRENMKLFKKISKAKNLYVLVLLTC